MTGLKKNLRRCNIGIFLVIVVLLTCGPGVAGNEKNKTGAINLAPYARVLVDHTAALTLSEVSSPDLINQLKREKNELSEREQRYRNLSRLDSLTGLFRRRYFNNQMDDAILNARQSDIPLALIVMDVDDFKQINDTHGHPEGDKVLKALSRIIRTSIRETDMACRYGGEEFAVFLPATARTAAEMVAERIRSRFCSSRFYSAPDQGFGCTVSLGLSFLETKDKRGTDLFHRADQALYEAKSRGKNQVRMTPIINE